MRASALLVPAVLAVLVASACSSQGEGDFCDPNNGNNDCADGLTCGPAPGIPGNTEIMNRDRCCPPPDQATTAVCSQATATIGDGGTEVPDAFALGVPDAEAGAAAEAGAPDTGSDAATGASDANFDAPPDAVQPPDAASKDGAPE